MAEDLNALIKGRIDRIKSLVRDNQGTHEFLEAGGLALTVLHDTVGGSHPLGAVIDSALKSKDWFLVAEERGSVLGSRTIGSYPSYSPLFDWSDWDHVFASHQPPPS